MGEILHEALSQITVRASHLATAAAQRAGLPQSHKGLYWVCWGLLAGPDTGKSSFLKIMVPLHLLSMLPSGITQEKQYSK